MVRYFEPRGHSTMLGDTISTVAAINASIIQGSVVGPTSYVIVASDLHPKHRKNLLTMYADDTYLLIGSSMIHTATEEFDNIQSWTAKNNLKIHPSKTKEMIVIGHKKSVLLPSSKQVIPGAKRVDTLRVLGVTLNQQLNMSDHIDRTLSSCASSQFALRTLRLHGLPSSSRAATGARLTTVASLLYASPAWWGFTTAEQRNRLERLLLRLRRGGFRPADSPSFEALARDADLGLFRSISSNPCHVLRHYFREREHTGHNLRPRAHNFALPIKNDRNFISCVLFRVLN